MPHVRTANAVKLVLAGIFAAAGCDGSPPTGVPDVGSLRVSVVTTGEDFDLNGYILQVDGAYSRNVSDTGTQVFSFDLAAGEHLVELSEVAENCLASPGNSRSVTVIGGETFEVTFAVDCLGTGVEVMVPATGLDLDLDYHVLVDGVPRGIVEPNSSLRITRLSPGPHEVALTGVDPNCTLAGPNPRSIQVSAHQVVGISFLVSCVTVGGSIEVTALTTGSDQDLNGYYVVVDDSWTLPLIATRTGILENLPAGHHSVALAGVSKNCTVGGGNPRPVELTAGGTTRDTARVTFQVSCARFWDLAFVRSSSIALASADGSWIEVVFGGDGPVWSPDGSKLAYVCGTTTCIASLDGSGTLTLSGTDREYDTSPAWRPDGQRIAVIGNSCGWYDCYFDGLYLMNPDGSGVSRISMGAKDPPLYWVSDLTWSPDGRQLAFSCWLDHSMDICLLNPDGTGFRRLTQDSASDAGPAWKPDGSGIAFHSRRYGPNPELVLIGVDGKTVTRLAPGILATDPAWSPDGQQIVFSGLGGLFVMNADGTGRTRLTSGPDGAPVWRP